MDTFAQIFGAVLMVVAMMMLVGSIVILYVWLLSSARSR